jgi:hypothetical protein
LSQRVLFQVVKALRYQREKTKAQPYGEARQASEGELKDSSKERIDKRKGRREGQVSE